MEKWEVESIIHERVCDMMNTTCDRLQTDLKIKGDMEITPYEYLCVADLLDEISNELVKIFTKRM